MQLSLLRAQKANPYLFNPIWTGEGEGGKMVLLKFFAEYLKNGVTDPHQTS